MFTESTAHRQRDLFDDMLLSLPEAKRKKALASEEHGFYREVFSRIDESLFAPLYPSQRGRSNSPVNAMVGAIVLREVRHWTFEELFARLDFDILTRLALGLTNLSDAPFCPATLFNFQNRLLDYEREHGINLLETVFDQLTAGQLKRFGVKTDIQRCDSFRAMSNIASYGRVRLLIEVLLRVVRILSDADRKRVAAVLHDYLGQTADNYVYRLDAADLPRELDKLASIYVGLEKELGKTYEDQPAWQMFERVLSEQFETDDGSVRVKERKELGSGTLQSPDDPDATYNAKGGKPQKGHKVNVVETASPDNDLNLIVDVATDANNVSDGAMLSERMDGLKERTPDLAEMHTDGGYGGSALDPKMEAHKVLHVETGTKMGKARVNMQYTATGDGGYEVTCPRRTVIAERTRKRWKADFHEGICTGCPHVDQCPTEQRKGRRTLYFEESWALSSIRSRNIELIPEKRRKLRANVEATMKQFTGCFNHKGKLRVRGRSRAAFQMLAMAMAINFGRIFRNRQSRPGANADRAVMPAAICYAVGILIHRIGHFVKRNLAMTEWTHARKNDWGALHSW
jgi:hypothetical protein